MPDWKPIRKLSPEEARSVREGKCWYRSMPCYHPIQCSEETIRCRRELEADLNSGYYGPEHMK